jgi:hypothetical protein
MSIPIDERDPVLDDWYSYCNSNPIRLHCRIESRNNNAIFVARGASAVLRRSTLVCNSKSRNLPISRPGLPKSFI